ncbi:MAG: UDP-N-acetylglucosamine 1-carboxyvinyltransferase, partial [Desulfovibrio sp.]|nr:UDP-N-acetylglucosamine 1-carboxyvinyltransferase [Desulfovibrio sp.]
ASVAEGETILHNAAREPEIVDLANFLNSCGADIQGQGSSTVTVRGVPKLIGADYAVMPDRIEAGTFLVAAGITGGRLFVKNCPVQALEAVILKLQAMGMAFREEEGGVWASIDGPIQPCDLKTQPYPGFPTDMQAQLMAMMCLASGTSMVDERIFENRFMHASELVRMGARISITGHSAVVRGVPKLIGAEVMASDLRASASLVLAGLAAEGTTQVRRIYHLDRGYERIEDKLCKVGAKIRREHEID